VCPRIRAEVFTRLCDPGWRDPAGLVHTTSTAPDKSVSFIRRLQVHDPMHYPHRWPTRPSRRSVQLRVMPGIAFPPVGPMGCGSPPSPILCSAKTATLPLSRHFAWRSRPDTLPASVRSWCPLWARARIEAPRSRQGFWSPGPPVRDCDKEIGGSPKFPSYPHEYMPRS
jgi:hypothetical protein